MTDKTLNLGSAKLAMGNTLPLAEQSNTTGGVTENFKTTLATADGMKVQKLKLLAEMGTDAHKLPLSEPKDNQVTNDADGGMIKKMQSLRRLESVVKAVTLDPNEVNAPDASANNDPVPNEVAEPVKSVEEQVQNLNQNVDELDSSMKEVHKFEDEIDAVDKKLADAGIFTGKSKLRDQKATAFVNMEVAAEDTLKKSESIQNEITAIKVLIKDDIDQTDVGDEVDKISRNVKNTADEVIMMIVSKLLPGVSSLKQKESEDLHENVQALANRLQAAGQSELTIDLLVMLKEAAAAQMEQVAGKNKPTDAQVAAFFGDLIKGDSAELLEGVIGKDTKFDDMRLALAQHDIKSSEEYQDADDTGKDRMLKLAEAQHELGIAKRELAYHLNEQLKAAKQKKPLHGDMVQSTSVDANLLKAFRTLSDADGTLDQKANLLLAAVRLAQDAVKQLDTSEPESNIDNLDDATFENYADARDAFSTHRTGMIWDAMKFEELDHPELSFNDLRVPKTFDAESLLKAALGSDGDNEGRFDVKNPNTDDEKDAWSVKLTREEFDKVLEHISAQIGDGGGPIEARRAKIEMGALADFGVDKNLAKQMTIDAGMEDAGMSEQISLLKDLTQSRLPSIQHTQNVIGLVNSVAGPLVGDDDTTQAGKGYLKAQSKYSPEVNARVYSLHAHQLIADDAHGLNFEDEAFADKAKELTAFKSDEAQNDMNLAGVKVIVLEAQLLRLMALKENPGDIEDPNYKKPAEIDKAIDEAMTEYETAKDAWNTAFDEAYENPDKVKAMVRMAILDARPDGTKLAQYDPTQHLAEINKKLESFGLDPTELRPFIVQSMMSDIDRSQMADWTAELDALTPDKKDQISAKQESAELLLSQAKEMEAGGWLYISSSGTLSASVTTSLEALGIQIEGTVGGGKSGTVELGLFKTENGYSLRIYAGDGHHFSASGGGGVGFAKDALSVKAKIGTYRAKSDFSGFTINFTNKDGKDPDKNLSRFLKAMASPDLQIKDDKIVKHENNLNLKDINIADNVSIYEQDAVFWKHSATVDGTAKYEGKLGPIDVSVGGGLGLGTSIATLTKVKESFTPDTHSTSRLTMFQFNRDAHANAALTIGHGGANDNVVTGSVGGNKAVTGSYNSNDEAYVSAGKGKGIKLERKGVVYGSSTVTRSNGDPQRFTGASFSFSTVSRPDPWDTVDGLAKLAGLEDGTVDKWKKDPEYTGLRDAYDEVVKENKSGADYVGISMTIKPDVLDKANKFLVQGQEKQAQALIDDKKNYEPTSISFNPTQEWTTSKTRNLAGVDIDASMINPGAAFSVSAQATSSDSGWGEMALPKKVPVAKDED